MNYYFCAKHGVSAAAKTWRERRCPSNAKPKLCTSKEEARTRMTLEHYAELLINSDFPLQMLQAQVGMRL
jgi:hypothetical protein